MNVKDLIKGEIYLYTDGTCRVEAKYLYSSINHSVFSCAGEVLSLSCNEVNLYIKKK